MCSGTCALEGRHVFGRMGSVRFVSVKIMTVCKV